MAKLSGSPLLKLGLSTRNPSSLARVSRQLQHRARLRPAGHHASTLRPLLFKPAVQSRRLATTSSSSATPRRRAITPLTDDGQTPWSSLSAGEKLARTTQQTFNLGLILLGFSMSCGIVYLLWTNVASPGSKTALFNRCVTEVRSCARVREALGPGKQIRAFGQASGWNRWTRNAAIPATYTTDAQGREHARLVFNVEGPEGRGVVRAHLVKHARDQAFAFEALKVEMPKGDVIWVHGGERQREGMGRKGVKFLGFDFGRK